MTGDSSLIQTGRTRQTVGKLTYQVLIILVVVQVTLIASWAWLWLLLWNSALNQPFVLQFAAVIGIRLFLRFDLPTYSAWTGCSSALVVRHAFRARQPGGHFSTHPRTGWLSAPAGSFSIHRLEWIGAGADGGLYHLDRTVRQVEKKPRWKPIQ